MDYFEISWAFLSLLTFIAITYFNYKILKNFDANERLSITKVFLNDKGPRAFQIFSIGITIYGISMFLGALTANYNDLIYHYGSKIGSGVMFAGWLYFMYTISEISTTD